MKTRSAPDSKIVLITGASQGLGASLARSFTQRGDRVLLHSRIQNKEVDRLVKTIKPHEVFFGALHEEVTSRAIFQVIKKRFGRLDCLVNNSGLYRGIPISRLTVGDWQDELNSTATATFLMIQTLLPLLRRCRGGRIINIGDSSCDRPTARDCSLGYHIGKTGVLMLTKSFAQSEARYGVTVNMVSPGWLKKSIGKLSRKEIPAGRFGEYADIWNAVEFLLKPESNYLTGSNLIVSGGWNLK